MKSYFKTLLPKIISYRDALIRNFSNIKPRFYIKSFGRLKILFLSLVLLGYQPILAIPPVSQNQVLAQNVQTQDIKAEELPQMSLPHPGYLSTRFSRWHPGIDLATGLGMPVRPISEGEVREVNFSFWGLGNHVIVTHPQGYKSIYGHMGKIYAKKGQFVNPVNILGEVGMTGWTSGPHTHLEIYKDDKAIDPLAILPTVQDYPGDVN
ncbi:M23 family metallopeptidase [Candidatus Daviesbacteria bacterium]|nr:M23 family metallopeptidase [Candidatus Daviesbacteria bacterium]